MLRNIVFLFALFLLIAFVPASKNKTQEVKVLNDYELSDKQYTAWQSIKNNWEATDFEKIKVEQKVSLNCKSCSAFYAEIIFTINASGKLESYKLVNGKKCGQSISKDLELRIMRNFFKFEFPVVLRGLSFQAKLGDVLKC